MVIDGETMEINVSMTMRFKKKNSAHSAQIGEAFIVDINLSQIKVVIAIFL